MVAFECKVDGREVVERVERFRRRGANLGPVMAEVSELLVTEVSDMYDTEGNGQWPELAEATIRSRRAGGSSRILQDSGRMAGSTEAFHGRDFAEAATDTEYAVHHVFGAPAANIPQRNPFEVPDEAFDRAIDRILTYVAEAA